MAIINWKNWSRSGLYRTLSFVYSQRDNVEERGRNSPVKPLTSTGVEFLVLWLKEGSVKSLRLQN